MQKEKILCDILVDDGFRGNNDLMIKKYEL